LARFQNSKKPDHVSRSDRQLMGITIVADLGSQNIGLGRRYGVYTPPAGGKGNRGQTDGCGPGRPGTSFFFWKPTPKSPRNPQKSPCSSGGSVRGFFPGPKTSQNLSKPKTMKNSGLKKYLQKCYP
jgi:hypothetical protein